MQPGQFYCAPCFLKYNADLIVFIPVHDPKLIKPINLYPSCVSSLLGQYVTKDLKIQCILKVCLDH
jgi:hypothetical protein